MAAAVIVDDDVATFGFLPVIVAAFGFDLAIGPVIGSASAASAAGRPKVTSAKRKTPTPRRPRLGHVMILSLNLRGTGRAYRQKRRLSIGAPRRGFRLCGKASC